MGAGRPLTLVRELYLYKNIIICMGGGGRYSVLFSKSSPGRGSIIICIGVFVWGYYYLYEDISMGVLFA